MALYLKDPEVGQLAERLAALRKTSKTEVVKQALRHELEQAERATYVERAVAFARQMRAKANPQAGVPTDRAFIDSLYED